MIGYWSRLVNGENSKIAFHIYSIAHVKHDNIDSNFRSVWLDKIKSILGNLERDNLWQARSFNADLKSEHKRFRKTAFEEQWQEDIEKDHRCSYYTFFKKEFLQEQYIKTLDLGNAITLAQLRTNNCKKFPTNKYKFVVDEWNVLCPLCDSGESGDELHYIFRCKNFEKVRPDFFIKIVISGPQTDISNLTMVLNNDRLGHLTRLAKFVRHVEFTLQHHFEAASI